MRLETWMRAEGLNQSRAAAWIGITPHYLSEILSGIKRPSGRLLAVIQKETGGAVLPCDFNWDKGNSK